MPQRHDRPPHEFNSELETRPDHHQEAWHGNSVWIPIGTRKHRWHFRPSLGCPDKTAINLLTWVLFADLIKAFNTVNHELMLTLIEHCRVPKGLIHIVKMMYTNVSVKLQVGKEKRLIPYIVRSTTRRQHGSCTIPFHHASLFGHFEGKLLKHQC
jgi:hypothetical protein